MRGFNSTVVTTDAPGDKLGYTTVKVRDPQGHISIMHGNNHYKAMLESTDQSAKEYVGDWKGTNCVMSESIKPEIAPVYSKYLELRGIGNKMVVREGDNDYISLSLPPDTKVPDLYGLGVMKGKRRTKSAPKHKIKDGRVKSLQHKQLYFKGEDKGGSIRQLFPDVALRSIPYKNNPQYLRK